MSSAGNRVTEEPTDNSELAEVTQVVAIQYGRVLFIEVIGKTTGDGTIKIVKDDTRVYPPSFSVFVVPGNVGITGEPWSRTVAVCCAFDGVFHEVQVRTAGAVLHPQVVSVPSLLHPTAANMVSAAAGASGQQQPPQATEPLPIGEWRAWLNLMPMHPTLHVVGTVALVSAKQKAALDIVKDDDPNLLELKLVTTPVTIEPTDVDGLHLTPVTTTIDLPKHQYREVLISNLNLTIPVHNIVY